MYEVLLVDDELFVRKGLINLMDWPSLQYEICGEADNGAQALGLIQELTAGIPIFLMPSKPSATMCRTIS